MKNGSILSILILISYLLVFNSSCSKETEIIESNNILEHNDFYYTYKQIFRNSWGWKTGEAKRVAIFSEDELPIENIDVFPFENDIAKALIAVNNIYLQQDPASDDIRIIDSELKQIISRLDIRNVRLIQKIDDKQVAISTSDAIYIYNTDNWQFKTYQPDIPFNLILKMTLIDNGLIIQINRCTTYERESNLIRLDLDTEEFFNADQNFGLIMHYLDEQLLVDKTWFNAQTLFLVDPSSLTITDTLSLNIELPGCLSQANIIETTELLYLYNCDKLAYTNKAEINFTQINIPEGQILDVQYHKSTEELLVCVKHDIDPNTTHYVFYWLNKNQEIVKEILYDNYVYDLGIVQQ